MANVLVVDHMHDVADSFAEVVTLFGHDVRIAHGAADTLREIEQGQPDVVLVDIDMPVADGFLLARRIREKCGPSIRLVAHTAHPRETVAANVTEAGFDSLVSKSARPLDLAVALSGCRRGPNLRSFDQRDRRKSARFTSPLRRSSDSMSGRESQSASG